jgi:hypothetical protein
MNEFRLGWSAVRLASVAIVAVIGASTSGEVHKIVSPSSMAKDEGNSSLRPNVAPNRLQFLFPASDFAGLPASQRFLVAINFRGDRTQTQAVDRIFPDGEWWMSTTDKTSATLSRVFADNHGPNKTLVQDGLYTFRILGTGPPQGPRDFADGMRFQKPFYYDPSQGNLLIEHTWRTMGSPVSQPALDNQSSPEFTLLVGGNPDAISGNLFTGRSITQFEFAAPPPGDFNQDGTVDAADYVVWRKGLGTIYTPDDFDLWRAHFGEMAGSGTTGDPLGASVEPLPAVPEPRCIVLGGSIVWALVLLDRKFWHGCRPPQRFRS